MVPILTLLADALGLLACYWGINLQGVTSVAPFANNILGRLTFGEVLPAVVKPFFFGFAIGLIGCYKGYNADNGTEGVGAAANSAVLLSSQMIFLLDLGRSAPAPRSA